MAINIYRKIKRNITEDGLIVSSSGFLVNTMVSKIDFSRPLRILEIGSGKGPFTREIIRRMSPESVLDVCEIKSEYNPWIERLMAANQDKRVTLHNGCVTELLTTADTYDVIVSSLPLKNFERMKDQNAFLYRIIEGFKFALKDGGIYLQYQYFRSNKSDIERVFGKEMDEIDFVPLNILPAFVYSMTK
ncbi:MAG: methyltransferase domain-containing protein [Gammaproteobacteria bacterium]|nr:methyltransferase domain-containing protein [Gammaproteobacteria bacterium]